MKISIESEKENPFLKRKELILAVSHEKSATPSRSTFQQLIVEQLGFENEKIDIINIFSHPGLSSSYSKVFVWHEKKPVKVKKEKTAEKVEQPAENKVEQPKKEG
ncbi:MAG: hypothetical protein V1802_03050 [Candidatus Aenigmatarchaeota archaeon]